MIYKEIKLNNYPENVPYHQQSMHLDLIQEKNYIIFILNTQLIIIMKAKNE